MSLARASLGSALQKHWRSKAVVSGTQRKGFGLGYVVYQGPSEICVWHEGQRPLDFGTTRMSHLGHWTIDKSGEPIMAVTTLCVGCVVDKAVRDVTSADGLTVVVAFARTLA